MSQRGLNELAAELRATPPAGLAVPGVPDRPGQVVQLLVLERGQAGWWRRPQLRGELV